MSQCPADILEGVKSVIDSHFLSVEQRARKNQYLHKHICDVLSESPPKSFDGTALVTSMYDCIEGNLAKRPDGRVPSPRNWRLRSINGDLSRVIKSAEVNFERAIVKNYGDSWTYQMPVASGIFNSYSDKRRAVDLVFNHQDDHYDLVELKVNSKAGSPLYAAIEILGYGLVYLASRNDQAGNLKYQASDLPVLRANYITLCVLALESYYKGSQLMWLQSAINEGLRQLCKSDLKMDFIFEKLVGTWCESYPIKDFPEMLIRKPVWQ